MTSQMLIRMRTMSFIDETAEVYVAEVTINLFHESIVVFALWMEFVFAFLTARV